MNKISVLTLLFLMFAVAGSAQHKFQWLIGTWKVKGESVYENWQQGKDAQTLVGLSYRIQETDTVITEKILLTYSSGAYHYIPDTPENDKPVDFTITFSDEKSFIAENEKHDFPKLIRYTIVRKANGESLEAAIEGNGKVISYAFERVR